jgi:Helix-turn-helix domain of resolvase
MPKAIGDEKVQQIISMRSKGTLIKVIAYETGTTRQTVGEYLRKHGMLVKSPSGRRKHKNRQCSYCNEIQTVSVRTLSSVCRSCEDNRKRGLWDKAEMEVSHGAR